MREVYLGETQRGLCLLYLRLALLHLRLGLLYLRLRLLDLRHRLGNACARRRLLAVHRHIYLGCCLVVASFGCLVTGPGHVIVALCDDAALE